MDEDGSEKKCAARGLVKGEMRTSRCTPASPISISDEGVSLSISADILMVQNAPIGRYELVIAFSGEQRFGFQVGDVSSALFSSRSEFFQQIVALSHWFFLGEVT